MAKKKQLKRRIQSLRADASKRRAQLMAYEKNLVEAEHRIEKYEETIANFQNGKQFKEGLNPEYYVKAIKYTGFPTCEPSSAPEKLTEAADIDPNSCKTCSGSGRIVVLNDSKPPYVLDCPDCKGTGLKPLETRVSNIKKIIFATGNYFVENRPSNVFLSAPKNISEKGIEAILFEVSARRKTECTLILRANKRDDLGAIAIEKTAKLFEIPFEIINL